MLAPGHHLYRGADGNWRYSAPGDVFVRIGSDDRPLSLVADIEAGIDVAIPSADQAAVEAVTAALTKRGVVVADRSAPRTPSRWTVHVEGDSPVAAALVALLSQLPDGPACVLGTIHEDAVRDADIVVSCADWLPDTRWCQLDGWCATHATPWHGCYAEGNTFVVGPLSIPGRTASYRDTRGRRLAAAALPGELLAHWAYLDSDVPRPPAPCPPAAAAVLAGLLAADLLALSAGAAVPTEGQQLVVDPATATISRHPVLPLPDLAVTVA